MLRKGPEISEDMRKCFRCEGRKKIYKCGAGWSLSNTGGKLSDCPMCLGKGQIKKLDAELKEKLDSVVEIKKEEVAPAKRRQRRKPEHIEQANTL